MEEMNCQRRSTKATRQKLDVFQKKHRVEVRLSDYDLDVLDATCEKLHMTRSQVLRGGLHNMNDVTVVVNQCGILRNG